ncbi:MAG TPA: hypothetical protein VLV83_21390, partial [Acidobacteriota bacterium]|nr:hypothetical protein [Acidobacteriota bacterium]
SLHRIVNGGPGGPPSFENLMRLCQAVGEHPARWFAAAGHVEMAYFLRETTEESAASRQPDPENADLRRHLEALLARGLGAEVRRALQRLEDALLAARVFFHKTFEESGAERAVILANHRMRGDVLVFAGCSEPQARAAAASQDALPESWTSLRRELGAGLEVVVLLYKPAEPDSEDPWCRCLDVWAAVLPQAWRIEQDASV